MLGAHLTANLMVRESALLLSKALGITDLSVLHAKESRRGVLQGTQVIFVPNGTVVEDAHVLVCGVSLKEPDLRRTLDDFSKEVLEPVVAKVVEKIQSDHAGLDLIDITGFQFYDVQYDAQVLRLNVTVGRLVETPSFTRGLETS